MTPADLDQIVQARYGYSAVAVASVVFLPVTLWSLPAGGVPAAAWPYLIATIVLHAL